MTASATACAGLLYDCLLYTSNAVKTVKDGSVDFSHVTFAYQQRSGKPVLSDIDLHIRSGETIGVMGGTGSSKSSLVSLISRLYDVTAGEVRVGGVDVRKYDVESLRDAVSVVLQNNVLCSGTIYDNLRWGNEIATDDQCREACRLACACLLYTSGRRFWVFLGFSASYQQAYPCLLYTSSISSWCPRRSRARASASRTCVWCTAASTA